MSPHSVATPSHRRIPPLCHLAAPLDDREGAAVHHRECPVVRHRGRGCPSGHRRGPGDAQQLITFPPDGVFFVRSTIEVASKQRVNFRFTSAVLRGKNWEVPLPPFGQGW